MRITQLLEEQKTQYSYSRRKMQCRAIASGADRQLVSGSSDMTCASEAVGQQLQASPVSGSGGRDAICTPTAVRQQRPLYANLLDRPLLCT